MQKGQTQVLILAGIVILIAVAGGIFFLGRITLPRQDSSGQAAPKPQPQDVANSSPQPSPTPDETVYTESDRSANWKIYTSTSGKFSVKYPSEWKVSNAGSIDTGTDTISFGSNITSATQDPNTKVWIQMQSSTNPNSPIKGAEDYKNSLVKGYGTNPSSNLSTTSATVDMVNGFKVSYIDAGIRITNVIVDRNGLIYSIALRQTKPYSDQDQQIFNQILSTFRFD